jgi:acyl-CoA synthetase (AMP-forming)/AMP-acid ligase II
MGLDNFLHDSITDEDTFTYTLTDILRMRADCTPDETAFIFLRDGEDDEEKITYKELDQAANASQALKRQNLQGERH